MLATSRMVVILGHIYHHVYILYSYQDFVVCSQSLLFFVESFKESASVKYQA